MKKPRDAVPGLSSCYSSVMPSFSGGGTTTAGGASSVIPSFSGGGTRTAGAGGATATGRGLGWGRGVATGAWARGTGRDGCGYAGYTGACHGWNVIG